MSDTQALSEEEWKDIEFQLFELNRLVKLKVDDYEVSIIVTREKTKLYLMIYVNGEFRFEWATNDCDIRKRFFCSSKHCPVSQKELNKITRSKKLQKEIKEKYIYISYSPFWSSFNRLKRHLIANNRNISIISPAITNTIEKESE